MDRRRIRSSGLATIGVVVVTALVGTACSGSSGASGPATTAPMAVPAEGGSVSPRDDVTITVPAGAVPEGTTLSSGDIGDPGRAALVSEIAMDDGTAVRMPMDPISSPIDVELSSALSAPVTISFALGADDVPSGSTPQIATFVDGHWLPVVSHWDPVTMTVSAQIDHLSWWAPFVWSVSRLASVLAGAAKAEFGKVLDTPSPVACNAPPEGASMSGPADTTVIYACLDTSPADQLLVQISNLRPYPMDLELPKGTSYTSRDKGSILEQVGQELSGASSSRRLGFMPGGSSGQITVPLAEGQSATIRTTFDNQAYLALIVDMLAKTLALISGESSSAAAITGSFDGAKCLQEASTTIDPADGFSMENASRLGKIGFDCVMATAKSSVGKTVLAGVALLADMGTLVANAILGIPDLIRGSTEQKIVVSRAGTTMVDLCGPGDYLSKAEMTRPTSLLYGCDGTGSLESITWSNWTATSADGTGVSHEADCVPSCAEAPRRDYPVTIHLSDPISTCAGTFFSTMTLTYSDPHPSYVSSGESFSYTERAPGQTETPKCARGG